MENNITNRMEKTRKQGRPSNDEILARSEPVPVEVIGDALPKLPAVQPMRCICCGRGMMPKVFRTAADRRWISCGLCGMKMLMVYEKDRPLNISKI